jgi:3'-phosphoadenosine 5'-phosphosulfate (PAPS) 3'-phosphatase
MSNYDLELKTAISIAQSAGGRILEFYNAQTAVEYEKTDGSPVTDADLAADLVIRGGIAEAFPEDAIMTEESEDDLGRLNSARCWIVDPLDGTAQFINRTGEFDVMIALVENEQPVVSVIYQPTTGLLSYATVGGGAWSQFGSGKAQRVTMHQLGTTPLVAASLYYGGRELTDVLHRIATSVGSPDPAVLTVGFQPRRVVPPTWIFDAFIGLWPPDGTRFAREWDLAAPQLFTTEAGGTFTDAYGETYLYNQRETRINRGLVVANSPDLHGALITAISEEFPG